MGKWMNAIFTRSDQDSIFASVQTRDLILKLGEKLHRKTGDIGYEPFEIRPQWTPSDLLADWVATSTVPTLRALVTAIVHAELVHARTCLRNLVHRNRPALLPFVDECFLAVMEEMRMRNLPLAVHAPAPGAPGDGTAGGRAIDPFILEDIPTLDMLLADRFNWIRLKTHLNHR